MRSHAEKQSRLKRSGQALLMVTFALIMMCGVMGLAVDLGWSYFVKKEAQAAADGAALAAVAKAQSQVGNPPYTCGTGVQCTAMVPCPSNGSTLTGNLQSACVYAALNGFPEGGNVDVEVQADVTTPAPTVPNVAVSYWVTVRVIQKVPQLFSAVLGFPSGTVSARATAALTNVIFNASLDLLNRENDPSGTTNSAPGTGVDLNIQGSGIVEAPGGMLVASKLNTAGGSSTAAANLGGTGSVTNTPFSLFRGPDSACIGNGGNICDKSMPTKGDWMQPPTPNRPDGNTFQDPTTLPTSSTKTQPPVTNPNNVCPVPGGTLTVKNVPSNCVGGGSFLPGIYYASVSSKDNTGTGAQLVFGDKTTTFGNGSGFGNYVFAGGFTTSAGNQTITFGSGMYVFAGTTNNNPEFVVDNGTTINDQNKGNTQSTQGELLLYTSGNYNWDGSNTIATMLTAAIPNFAQLSFQYGQGGFTFKGGNNSNTSMTLYGLNPDPTTLPPSVANYHDFLFWQDRANSTVLYSPTDGSIVSSPCPGSTTNEVPGLPANINNPCKNSLNNPDSPQMNLFATPNTNLNGYLYQPRGAWLNLQGGGKIGGPLRIITGALQLGGGPTVILTGTSAPITVTETALIE